MLTSKLVSELFSHDSSRSDRRRVCRLLCGLGYESEACLLYLERSSEEIRNHHRLVKACGDIPSLVEGLSDLFFECLQDTAVNFESIFGGGEKKSAFCICVSWMTKEIDQFIKQIVLLAMSDDSRQMTTDDFQSFACCVSPLLRGATVLSDVGCSMDCYVMRTIGEKVQSVVEQYLAVCIVRTVLQIHCRLSFALFRNHQAKSRVFTTVHSKESRSGMFRPIVPLYTTCWDLSCSTAHSCFIPR